MRTINNRLLGILIATVFLVPFASPADSPFTGAFIGSGYACYGSLYVRTKTISWLTPLSQCQKVPYEVIARVEKGNQRQLTFRLTHRNKGCRFEVLYLSHADTPNPDLDWNVIGYTSVPDYQADKQRGYKAADPPHSLSCYLVTR